MKLEMPKSLSGIEKAAESLAQASSSLKSDPYSQVDLNLIKILNTPNMFLFYRLEEIV